jgi:hypothetical protein
MRAIQAQLHIGSRHLLVELDEVLRDFQRRRDRHSHERNQQNRTRCARETAPKRMAIATDPAGVCRSMFASGRRFRAASHRVES